MNTRKFYNIVYQNGKAETLSLTPEQAVELSMTNAIKSVVPKDG